MKKRSKYGGTALYETLRTASLMTDRVLVGISGGKDSAVALDLCCQFFPKVVGFFLYIVKGLSFQERILQYYERRYGIEILRLPHFMLSDFLRYGSYRLPDLEVPTVSTKETYDYVREKTGIYWIACGERISDSIIRRAMIRSTGTIDEKRGRIYPVAYWNKKTIVDYISKKHLKLGEDSSVLGFSFRSLDPIELQAVYDHYPADYQRIMDWFPLVEASRRQGDAMEGIGGDESD